MIVGYQRVSTQRQAIDGVSIDMQKEMIIKHARFFNLISTEKDISFYCDDGYSGGNFNRPAMTKLLNDIKSETIDCIICYDFSRISRNIFDSQLFIDLLKKYNVVLKCIYDDINVETAGGRFSTNIKIVGNQFEREKIIERTNDSLLSIAEKGRYPNGGKIPFGWIRGEDKQIYIDNRVVDIVKNTFNMGYNNCPLPQIQHYINNAQNLRHFTSHDLHKMFYDKRYSGEFVYKNKTYYNIVPAIVSIEVQNRVINFYKKKKYKKINEYIFDGLMICSCGQKMSCASAHGRHKIYFYYKCTNCNYNLPQSYIVNFINRLNIPNNNLAAKLEDIDKERYKLKRRTNYLKELYLDKQLSIREYFTAVIPLEDALMELNGIRSGIKHNKTNVNFEDLITTKDKKDFAQANIQLIEVDFLTKKIKLIKYRQ